jgi:hypothetical protein
LRSASKARSLMVRKAKLCVKASLLYDSRDERFRMIFNFVLNFVRRLP